jgi:predicted amidophosphoribosyltransferase
MTSKPLELARAASTTCPACQGQAPRVKRCRCCRGTGKVLDVEAAAGLIQEERDRGADNLYAVVSYAQEAHEAQRAGKAARIVSVEE